LHFLQIASDHIGEANDMGSYQAYVRIGQNVNRLKKSKPADGM